MKSAMLETEQGWAQRTCLRPHLWWVWWTWVSPTATRAATVPHGVSSTPVPIQPSVGLRRQQVLCALASEGEGFWKASSCTLPAALPSVSLPWALLHVPQLPRPKFVTCFQVAFLKEPQEQFPEP